MGSDWLYFFSHSLCTCDRKKSRGKNYSPQGWSTVFFKYVGRVLCVFFRPLLCHNTEWKFSSFFLSFIFSVLCSTLFLPFSFLSFLATFFLSFSLSYLRTRFGRLRKSCWGRGRYTNLKIDREILQACSNAAADNFLCARFRNTKQL